MNLNGYIKLHRKMMAWQWKSHPPTLCLFIHLLLSASYEEKVLNTGTKLKPGQVIVSRKILSQDTGLTEDQVRTALAHLRKTGEITVDTSVGCRKTIVTIQNWPKYQESPSESPGSDGQGSQTPQGIQGIFNLGDPQVFPQVQKSPGFPPGEAPRVAPGFPPGSDGQGSQTPQGIQGISKNGSPGEAPRVAPGFPPGEAPANNIKKSKKNKKIRNTISFAEYVDLEQAEFDRLVEKFGEPFARKCVEVLDNYKGADPGRRKYSNDYKAILSWTVDRVKHDYPHLMKRQPQQQTLPETTTTQPSEWGDGI